MTRRGPVEADGSPESDSCQRERETGPDVIRIRGARVHNLKSVDIDIPRDRLVVITGPSGSGKSSLAFDTLFAEGQRQYIESLSVYARQFLHQMPRPDVDLIDGLQPTISIDQRTGSHNPRSTVATLTEIHDYLRLLFARVGQPYCSQCDRPICQQTPEEIEHWICELPEGAKAMILAPLIRGRRGRHQEVLNSVRKAGLARVRVNGDTYLIEEVPELSPRKRHRIEAVVDRVIIRDGIAGRLADSIRLAIKHADGLVLVAYLDPSTNSPSTNSTGGQAASGRPSASTAHRDSRTWREMLFSTQYACPQCGMSLEELEPRTFSYNSPYGACPTCQGLGVKIQFDPELVLPDLNLSLAQAAIAPWRGATPAAMRKLKESLKEFLDAVKVDWEMPLSDVDAKGIHQLLHGNGKKYLGVLNLLEKEYATTSRSAWREHLEVFRGQIPCSDCRGARLRPEARACRVGEKAIHEISTMTISDARRFFEQLKLADPRRQIAAPITSEIVKRLTFLEKVGAEYLTLDRPADTLSGGEMQRVRLATGIGSGLVGVCYLLDEPSIGLHPRDNQQLIGALRDLQSQGNTVVVVEHDAAMMREADHLIDMGPGAGQHGGQVVDQGSPEQVCHNSASITGQFLTGKQRIAVPQKRRRIAKMRSIELIGATTNNLKDVTVRFPLAALVCVTGVSGSGKSSLVSGTLASALARRLGQIGPKPGPHKGLRGIHHIDRLIQIDQSPIGRTPRSNPATYTGLFDEIRKVFAGTKEARQHGYKVGRFSFNVKSGRCEACQGQGVQKIEMNFLPDLYATCSECEGARFNRQTLQIRYRDFTIADVLDMRVDKALDFFQNFPVMHRMLSSLHDVGLDYLALGQPATTLSGGEAQRIKLATELGRPNAGRTLFVLDEPTMGLHFCDIQKLLDVLQSLVNLGNHVLIIEHNLDVIKSADWIIDLGPDGGKNGGQVVATGTPEAIAALQDNHTAAYLRPLLAHDVAPG